MFRKTHVIKINLPGGIVSAGHLYSIIQAAEKVGIEEFQFGTRQQLYAKVNDQYLQEFTGNLEKSAILYEVNEEKYPNILSSYVTEDVFQHANWVSEGMYKDILDLFDYTPKLKINLVDSNQTFIPYFTGNINFIASNTGNYWFLYIRFPKTNFMYKWRGLVYSQDIPRISKVIEQSLLENKDMFYDQPAINGDLLQAIVNARETIITQPLTEELKIPNFSLPYYEGFNHYDNKLWLGIYRRDECFPVSFLKDLCLICLQSKVGQLYTTPWKSLIIKGIEQSDKGLWEYALGKYRINVRHASNELNWQVEDMNEEGLNLKRYLIRQFDKDDVRTFGLCFAIKTELKSGLFGSVFIQKQLNEYANKSKALDRYDIHYTSDFNPNSKSITVFRKNVQKEDLGTYLISLCKYFYELQNKEDMISHHAFRQEAVAPVEETVPAEKVFQCRHCFTMYDKQYGDEINGILPGIEFEKIVHGYECPTCGAPGKDFVAVGKPALKHV